MKAYKPFSKVTLYACLCAFVISGIFVYYQDKRMIEESLERISGDIELLRQNIIQNYTATLEASRMLASDVETLKQANSDLFLSNEQIRKDAEKKITALQSQVTSTQSGLDLSAIIKDWRPFIAKVTCSWHSVTEGYTATGSGLLFKTAARPFAHLVTNKHVVTYKDNKMQECKITFPDTKDVIEISENSIGLSAKGLDFGTVDIASRSAYIDALASQTSSRIACLSATVGEKVVILGYPSIGSKDDITATEGIISGADGDYYITSAKVEQGNSGGAAILIRNGGKSCYLGIPTFVDVGRVESLARILSAKALQ